MIIYWWSSGVGSLMYSQHRKLQIAKSEATSQPASLGSYLWRYPCGHDGHLPTFSLSGPKHGTWQPAINVATETKNRKECPFAREEAENHWLMANLESETEMALRRDMDQSEMWWDWWSAHVIPFRHLERSPRSFERSPNFFLPFSCIFQDPVSHLLQPELSFKKTDTRSLESVCVYTKAESTCSESCRCPGQNQVWWMWK